MSVVITEEYMVNSDELFGTTEWLTF